MAIDTSIADLWWLQQDKPPSAVPAMALGAQMAQNRVVNGIRQIEAQNEFVRNRSFLMTQLAKQNSEVAKQNGMAEIGTLLSKIAVSGDWTNPEHEKSFWGIAAKYPQAMDDATVTGIYNNSFKAARERKEKADLLTAPISEVEIDGEKFFRQPGTGSYTRVHPSGRDGGNPPAVIATDKAAAELESQADQLLESNPTESANLRARAEGIRNAARLTPAQQGAPDIGETQTPDGRSLIYYRDNRGNLKFIPPPKTNMSDFDRIEYTTELKALQSKFEDGDIKQDEFDRQREELHKKFQGRRLTIQPKLNAEPVVDPNNPLGLKLTR